MTDSAHPTPALLRRHRPHRPRLHARSEELGLCALEDYTCLAGESVAMRSLRAQLRRVAPHFRVALITGEDGTGAETIALALHRLVADSDATFLPLNADSLLTLLPETLERLPEDQHAGRPAGFEPDAVEARQAVTFKVPASTLFHSDAGDLTYGEQMYLLQALQRLAALRRREDRPRMIFSTQRDLRILSATGHFDRSLHRHISAVEIIIPPLRSRPEDIPLITSSLLSRSAQSGDMTAAAFDGRALSRLQCYDWPGNIRELEQVVDHARRNAGTRVDGIIEAVHLPPLGGPARTHSRQSIDTRVDRLEDVVQAHVLDVLLRCSGNKLRAAERLGISRSTLYRMLEAGTDERAS